MTTGKRVRRTSGQTWGSRGVDILAFSQRMSHSPLKLERPHFLREVCSIEPAKKPRTLSVAHRYDTENHANEIATVGLASSVALTVALR